MSLLVVVL